jgi:hypothetical protein
MADFVAEVGLEGGAVGARVFYGRAGTMALRQPKRSGGTDANH